MSNETISAPSLLFKECEFPNNPYYILFISIISFYLPLIFMIYVYIQVYWAAKKQVLALRCGYKHHYSIKSAKSFVPKFILRKTSTEERPNREKTVGIYENNTHEKSAMLLKNRRPSFQLITLRIHHGAYQNPGIEPFSRNSRNNNKSINTARRKYLRPNSLWKKFSKDQKAARFIGIVMGVFVVCWLPYFVYLLLSGVFVVRLKDDQYHELLFKIFSWLGYTNSALDVLVYVSTSKELRATFFKLFSCHRFRFKLNSL
jgi:hypothetical protein